MSKFIYSLLLNVQRYVNHLYTEFHYTLNSSSSEAIDTLYNPYLHFWFELALETSAKYSSITESLRVHDLCHAHLLASLQIMVRGLNASPN